MSGISVTNDPKAEALRSVIGISQWLSPEERKDAIENAVGAMEVDYPDLWKTVYPRAYVNAGAWHSVKPVALRYALAFNLSKELGSPEHLPDVFSLTFQALCRGKAHAFPTYFISRSLWSAILQTEPPLGIALEDVKFPFPSITFMPPRGFQSPADGEITSVTVTQYDDGIAILSASETGTVWDAVLKYSLGTLGAALSFFRGGPLQIEEAEIGQHHGSADEEHGFSNSLVITAFGILLAITARPELVESGKLEKKASKKTLIELWSPTVIGGRYRAARDPKAHSTGSHASPRTHWRRGHFRSQAFGLERMDRRVIWIEPCLVVAREVADTMYHRDGLAVGLTAGGLS